MNDFQVTINGRRIQAGYPSYIIAEVGSNHDNNLETALSYVDALADAGADAVKFQLFTADRLVNPILRPDFFKVIQQFSLPRDWLTPLSERAKAKRIDFLATPFDLEAVSLLQAIGVPAFKVASSDLTNWPLLKAVGAAGKPILLSTGLAYLGEIESTARFLRSAGVTDLAVLHCVAAYPTAESEANLRVIPLLQQVLKAPIGFSDHTLGLGAPVAAVAQGACIIEKHVTFDKKHAGPDHWFALDVEEFRLLVRIIREAEKALGECASRELVVEEVEDRERARRGIFAWKRITAGTQLTEDTLITLRPRDGIGAEMWDEVVGKVTRMDIEPYQPLSWPMFET